MNEMQGKNWIKDNSPFRLKDSGIHEVLKIPVEDKNTLVKKIPTSYDNPEIIVRECNEKRRLFKDFSSKYGVNAPDVDYVIGPSSNIGTARASLYQVKDRIYGIEFDEEEETPEDIPIRIEELPRFKEEIEKTLSALSRYWLDAYSDDSPYLFDIFYPRQYTYGKKAGEGANKMYLVDVDDFRECAKESRLENAIDIAIMISYFEEYLGGTKLFSARLSLLNSINSLTEDNDLKKELLTSANSILNTEEKDNNAKNSA